MPKILITGGACFIGSHLCDSLIQEGNEVICMDNLFTGTKNNIKHLFNNPKFEFIEQDIIQPFYLAGKIDQIYNLACPASPVHYQINPVETIKTSTAGVINLLELARRKGACILQASTSEVYGDPEVHPQPEHYRGHVNTLGPRACYDEGKRVAETLFSDYLRQHKVNIRIARIFNTYGPRITKNDGRVISNFLLQALENKNITIYGNGSQTRSFCYYTDLIDGLKKLMNVKNIHTPINLGNPKEFTILELANKVIKLTESKSKTIFKPLPIDDPKQRSPSIELAKEKLNWCPKVELEEGLKKTIEYFKSLK